MMFSTDPERLSTVPSLYQLNQGVLCDVVAWDTPNTGNTELEREIPGEITYMKDLPSAYVMQQDWFQKHQKVWIITLEEQHDL